jgi:hypothetical protein
MDELVKQILLLNEIERRKLLEIITASMDPFEEGHVFFESDFSEESLTLVRGRIEDIENEKPCLIEFDDHISIII